MTPDDRADALAAIAIELAGERFGPGRLPQVKVPVPAEVIAERRRILVGGDEQVAVARIRERRLAGAIRRWQA